MSRIDAGLLQRLETRLGVSRSRVYERIADVARARMLDRRLAAIALAAEVGVGYQRFASSDDLAAIRGTSARAPSQVSNVRAKSLLHKKHKVKKTSSQTAAPSTSLEANSKVWVVYGRNAKLARAMKSFLRTLGLEPLEWTKAKEMTGKASPYVGEVLEVAFGHAAAVVVLFTPDDEARLREEFVAAEDPAFERRLTGQARPNVLFEAGMAMGYRPNSAVLVQVGETRPFTDTSGRHFVRLNNSARERKNLIAALRAAGCNVDDSGSDWMDEGDFAI